jgi:hypothetical protein
MSADSGHFDPFQNASSCRYDVLSLVSGAAMRRHEFIALVGAGAASPMVASAQQTERMRRNMRIDALIGRDHVPSHNE